ncbi:MAG TPA: zinc dependent phospholipase C family protein [Saprospiraceae bacterium]|nr:zinc dependent phospholipase C family protein [Saprospiraceae bacterium]
MGYRLVTGFLFMVLNPLNPQQANWGFFGHKWINRMAVFTLPEEMIGFYKAHLDEVVSHAVDPDKRRYSVPGEAFRHYIDLDQWQQDTFVQLPETHALAVFRFSHFYLTDGENRYLLLDTLRMRTGVVDSVDLLPIRPVSWKGIPQRVAYEEFLKDFMEHAWPYYDHEDWAFPANQLLSLKVSDSMGLRVEIEDRFTAHGILPYHLERVYLQLTNAFRTMDQGKIIRWSAELGHYLGDGHVPLHTTKNYNGQLTGQDGIHAFWESRIPELFAEQEFDPLVGPAQYIPDIRAEIWKLIRESHSGVNMLLEMERELRQRIPADQQECFDERLQKIVKLPCREFARRYHEALDRQVEDRMRTCILSLGSFWYSAWVDAGQPDLLPALDVELDLEMADSGRVEAARIRSHE